MVAVAFSPTAATPSRHHQLPTQHLVAAIDCGIVHKCVQELHVDIRMVVGNVNSEDAGPPPGRALNQFLVGRMRSDKEGQSVESSMAGYAPD